MARSRETGFYFEPLSERLALVMEGAPFPNDEHWAWLGDPTEMTPEQAQLECAVRWPGIDPEALHVELDLGMNALLAELEQQQRSEGEVAATHQLSPPDVASLLAQAEELQRAVSQLGPGAIDGRQLEAQAEELQLARAAAAISAAARSSQANRELREALAKVDEEDQKPQP